MPDISKTDPHGIYQTDNGAIYCGAHLGASARFTGRDISGQAIQRLTVRDVADAAGWSVSLKCEVCGRKATTQMAAWGPRS